MANVLRNPYSNTAGNTPSSLGNGQIGVNQSDGRIFFRNSAGAVATFSSIASYATVASFPATGSSTLLYLAADNSRIYQWSGVYAEIGVASGYTLPNATSSVLGGVVVGAGLSVSSGTVSANVVSVAGRTGTVTISSGDVSGLGSLATANSVAYSSLTGTPSTFSPSSHASSHAIGGADAISIASSQVTGLPTAGTASTNYCAGDDARLSDARTPTSHAASHATGGSDAITAANIGAAATSHVHAATDITSGTLADARLSSNVATYATLAPAGNSSSSVIDIFPRGEQSGQTTAITSGTLWITFFTPQVTLTVSSITMVSTQTAGASLTLARMGLYTFDETTATLVARCASDTTLFTSNLTAYTRSFATAGGFPSSYTLTAGTRYGVGVIVVGTTMPSLGLRPVNIALSSLTPRMSGTLASQSDLPTSATITSSQQSQPFARLS